MTSKLLRLTPLALALLLSPTVSRAQQPAPQPAADLETDTAATAMLQGLLTEIQAINGRLQELQQAALQDSALSTEQAALGESIRTTMTEADPTLEASMARVEELQAEAEAAQQRGDDARLNELGAEVRRIEVQFVQAQQQALANPELSAQLESFQTRLEAKMAELDPEAPQLIARFQQLQERLASAMQAGG